MINRGSNRFIDIPARHIGLLFRLLLTKLMFAVCLGAATVCAFGAEQRENEPLRVAVYDVPPYGYVDSDGSISGVSVDLWRRVAEQIEWPFKLIPVSDMEFDPQRSGARSFRRGDRRHHDYTRKIGAC